MATKKIEKVSASSTPSKYALLIKNPRITEKTTMVNEGGVYTFDVSKNATKVEIKKAIKDMFGVAPRKVNVVTILAKKVFVRGKHGKTAGGRKAYVYLKKGDTLELA